MNKKSYVTCNVCDGTGKNPIDLTDQMKCWKCHGEGSIYVMVFDQQPDGGADVPAAEDGGKLEPQPLSRTPMVTLSKSKYEALQAEIERLQAANVELTTRNRALQERAEKAEAEATAADAGALDIEATLAVVRQDLEAIVSGMTGDYTPTGLASLALSKITTNAGADLLARLTQAEAAIAEAHAKLDTAGVPSAVGAKCDDPACNSHIVHRVHSVITERDAANRAAEINYDLWQKAAKLYNDLLRSSDDF